MEMQKKSTVLLLFQLILVINNKNATWSTLNNESSTIIHALIGVGTHTLCVSSFSIMFSM